MGNAEGDQGNRELHNPSGDKCAECSQQGKSLTKEKKTVCCGWVEGLLWKNTRGDLVCLSRVKNFDTTAYGLGCCEKVYLQWKDICDNHLNGVVSSLFKGLCLLILCPFNKFCNGSDGPLLRTCEQEQSGVQATPTEVLPEV